MMIVVFNMLLYLAGVPDLPSRTMAGERVSAPVLQVQYLLGQLQQR